MQTAASAPILFTSSILDMQLSDIMSAPVLTVESDESADKAWTQMRRRDVRHLAVMEDSQLVGVLSERDLGGRAGAKVREGRLVRSLMTPTVTTATPDTPLDDAADLMRARLIGSLPVVDGDKLVGIVTATDVFDALGEAGARLSSAEQQLLRQPTSSKRLGGNPVVRAPKAKTTRKRRRPTEEDKRAPLAARVPKSIKREAGRTTAPLVPANIRVQGIDLDPEDREYIRKRLGMKLGKFARSIERVTVRITDVNGPRGGVDHVANIKVVLSGLPSVVVESQGEHLHAAVNDALDRVARSVRRSLTRRRSKPLRGSAR